MQNEPLKSLDELQAFDGDKYSQEVIPKKCKHKLKLISSTEARCEYCTAGYTGQNVSELVNLLKTT